MLNNYYIRFIIFTFMFYYIINIFTKNEKFKHKAVITVIVSVIFSIILSFIMSFD